MPLDVVIILIIALWSLFGLATGALKQIAHAVSLVVAVVLARPCGKIIAGYIVERGQPEWVATVLGMLLAGMVIFSLAKLLFWIVNAYLGREGGKMGWGSRLLGAAIGGAKAVIVVWLLSCLLLETGLMQWQFMKDIGRRLEQSKIAVWMSETYNPIAGERVRLTLKKLKLLAENPRAIRNLARDPKVKALLAKLRVKLIERLKDKDTLAQVVDNDPVAIVRAARLRDFLSDQALIDAVIEIDAGDALDAAVKGLAPEKTD